MAIHRYCVELIEHIIHPTSLLIERFPMPLNAVFLYDIHHPVTEIISHLYHHVKSLGIPSHCVLIKKALHNLQTKNYAHSVMFIHILIKKYKLKPPCTLWIV